MKPKHPYIDYTLLDEAAPLDAYAKLAMAASEHEYAVRAVCVPPLSLIVTICQEYLHGSDLGICTVIDFPFGDGGLKTKQDQVIAMLDLGVKEFDVVINLPALRNGDLNDVHREIKTLAMMTEHIRIKAILETGHEWYNETLVKTVSRALHDAGVWCLKTSTGRQNHMTSAGFLPHIDFDDKLRHAGWMHEACPDLMIKVAGGIASLQQIRDICVKIPKDKVLVGASKPIWLNGLPD
ncbi:MAG: hypothetical protein HZA25_01140 [Candidatus Niyogibacteria bacterium]|nr:hypothetical protein [Candidatus Niyogibacteria bacterium]